MIESAGGENLISTEKMPSRKMKLEETQEVNPDIIVMMPCGFDASEPYLNTIVCWQRIQIGICRLLRRIMFTRLMQTRILANQVFEP